MKKLISFQHISLDGFVAGPKGEMNWIKANDEIFTHVGQRIHRTEAALYGRNTFGMMEAYWPNAAEQPGASPFTVKHAAWYKQAHKVVLSRTLQAADYPNTTIISDHIAERLQEIKKQGPEGEILLFGSPTAAHSLMQHDLIDGYWLFVNPIILGEGIPLFVNNQSKLQLSGTRKFDCGVIAQDYLVDRS